MKRLTIFTHHDKDNIIDNYIIYWIKYMSKLSDVIFVSNNNLDEKEVNKIKNYTIKNIIGEHGGFGEKSIKLGFCYAYDNNILQTYDWLIYISDSIYGPFFDIKPYMESKEKKDNVCYGFAKSLVNTSNEHIQDTFLAIPKKAFLSKEIQEHFFSLDKLNTKKEACLYGETKISNILKSLGFSLEGWFDDIDPTYKKYEPMKPSFVEIIKKGYPFLRKTIFTKNYIFIENLKDYLKLKDIISTECFNNIQKNIDRVIPKEDLKINLEYPEIRKTLRYKINIIDNNYITKYNHHLEFLEVTTFIEKLIWLKLNYHTEYIINLSDKYLARQYVEEKVGKDILIPILAVYNSDAEILFNLDIESLPDNILFTSTINDNKITIQKNDTYNYKDYNYNLLTLTDYSSNKYFDTFEWQYKYIKPRLLVYENKEIYNKCIHYKIMCFNSKPKIIKTIIKNDLNATYSNFYDLEWNKLDLVQDFPNIENIEKPIYLKKMIDIAVKLSEEFPIFVSIDFIGNGNEFYFEKFDFYSDELLHPFSNIQLDKEFGSYIKIPDTKNEYFSFDKDTYIKVLIKYDELIFNKINKLNNIKNKIFELNNKIDKLAWWIPIKSLRDKVKAKFKIDL